MSLSKGDRLGPYEITGIVGKGGMGEVYRARDSRLGRDVAVKILPAATASDPAAVARFETEARSIAALSHPHILAIHDVGHQNGIAYAVTELLEGETLRDRVNGGRLTIRKAVEIAQQVAQGLAAAHAKNIIHRDLKPENIFLTADGHAKILDFGLAKIEQVAATDATVTARQTDPGTVLGTTGYLSPEQAQAKPLDARSDTFSFGAVLYEMVTGTRAFKGDSTIDTLHAIVHNDPKPIDLAAPDVPGELRWVIDKCLAKDPDERYQSTRDLAVDLKSAARALDSSPKLPVTAAAVPRAHQSSRTTIIAVAIVVAAVVIGAAIVLKPGGSSAPAPAPAAATLSIEPVTSLGTVIDAAISPDGKYVVYATAENARQGLSIRQLATGSTIALVPPLAGGMWGASFAPDGNSIYYGLFTPDEPTRAIYRVPILGGTSRKLVVGVDSEPTFSPDGKQMAWVRSDFPGRGESAVMVADIDGQHVRTLVSRKPPEYFAPIFFTMPSWSPDGARIVAPVWNSEKRVGTLAAYRPDGSAAPFPKYEWPAIGQANWLPDGSALIAVGGTDTNRRNQLWLVSADREERRQITNDFLDYRRGMTSADGKMLVAVASAASSTIWVAPVDGSHDATRLTTARQDGISGVAALADGRILFRSLESGTPGIWVMKEDGGGRTQVTTDGVSAWPAAMPDGKSVVFAREGSGLWRAGIDGQGAHLIDGSLGGSYPQVSPDGQTVYFTGGATVTTLGSGPSALYGLENSLLSVPIAGGTPKALLDPSASCIRPAISPDGRQIACYYREQGGASSIAVLSIDGHVTQKFSNVAPSIAYALVRWTADGKGLLHNSASDDRSNIWLQPLDGSKPKQVTKFSDQTIFAFDRSPDGKKLIIARGTLTRDAVLIRNFR